MKSDQPIESTLRISLIHRIEVREVRNLRSAFFIALPLEWHEVAGQHAFLRDEGPRYDPALFLQAMAWTLALYARALR